MFAFAAEWEQPINMVFLLVTAAVAIHAIRYRDAGGERDFVRLLFGCIAAVFFCLVLFQDVLGVVSFK